MLTLMLTAVGIVAAFPIGVSLALGRRSSLPVVSTVCTLYIELVRGVPLITVLFMSMLLVPFVAPQLGGPDTAPYRAMVAVTLFSAAYLAENVRGGLQSLPPGQEEAAKALGLAGWQVMLFITLPQALRAVIPALVGQFISLFKDTSLVAIVGLVDLTGVTRNVSAQTEFQGLVRETYVFIALIYFTFSFVMSRVSRRIEASGSGAARRV
jgi:general L-amino acid transport system permease protein